MVAHTGIAANLLINGSTVHRQFAVPLNTSEESDCQIEPFSFLEAQLKGADVIIWDEATMSDRRVFECVDRALRDIMQVQLLQQPSNKIQKPELPFGGKTVLLGGD